MRVFLPIRLDRWSSSIPSILRETSIRIPDINFYSFSGPAFEEDRILGQATWAAPNLHRVGRLAAFREPFDIVHIASATNRNIIASLVARSRAFGGCCHLYSAQVEPYRRDPWYWHYRFAVSIAHRLTAVSHAVAETVKREFGRSVDAIIPNGVNLEFFAPEVARPIDFEREGIRKPFVLFVGYLEARKRPDVFIELSKLLPELDFVMLGGYLEPTERDSYLALIRECPNVKFLGLRPRALVRDFYASALALVHPSEIEGLALGVIEAQAMGLPVLAQPKTCMPEIVREDLTGWLFAVNNLDLWVRKLREILGWSESRRKEYALNSRARTSKHYSWEVIAPQYREVYIAAAAR
jgi:glycosyltransferase involved in cell wall biosynthesis